jgi:hypothetical protein
MGVITPSRCRSALAVLATFWVVTATGCGGSGQPVAAQPSAAASGPSPAHDRFVRQLDSLCDETNRSLALQDKAFGDAAAAGDLTRAGAILEGESPQLGRYLARIERLRPPGSDRAVFSRYLSLTRRIRGLVPRVAAALRAQDVEEITRLDRLLKKSQSEQTEVAIDLGTTYCGS